MDAYRRLVRKARSRDSSTRSVRPAGPRVQMVNPYFRGLTGQQPPTRRPSRTRVGQLGALRDRFGLIDANVNTVEEEGVRTSFWTLVDLVADLQAVVDRPAVRSSPAAPARASSGPT